MRIHIVTAGTRGDIEPLAILARGFGDAGYRIAFAANDEGAALCAAHGVPFVSLGFSVADLLASETGQAMLASASPSGSHGLLIALCAQALPVAGPRIFDACRGADVILCQDNVFPECYAAAQAFGRPLVALNLMPYGATAAYPHPYASDEERGTLPARETHRRATHRAMAGTLVTDNELRRNHLGLPPLSADDLVAAREATPALLGYSPLLFPAPPDWPATRIVTGAWRSPAPAEPDAELAAFVAAGPPPIYVGFGSMMFDAGPLTQFLDGLAARSGQRIVFVNPWLDETTARRARSSTLFVARTAAHDWLLPRCALAVHHGGAGTTAASTRAGVPTLIAWFIVDQRLWAERVEQLGIGRNLGPFTTLAFGALGHTLESALDDFTLRERSASMGARLANERGVDTAVAALPGLVARLGAASE